MTVLILGREVDPAIDRMVEELSARSVPVFRTDLVAFPQQLTLETRLGSAGWEGSLITPHRRVRLADVRSIWYRHPSHFELPSGMSEAERRHAAAEARVGLSGVLNSLDVRWVNHPSREADALKPRQLQVARACGLRVPRSLVTNCPDAVREFARAIDGPLAGKALAATLLVESNRLQTVYTRRIEPTEIADLAGLTTTAHLFPAASSWRICGGR